MTNEELINNIVSQYIAQLKPEVKVSKVGTTSVKVKVTLKCGSNVLGSSESTATL